MGRVSARLEAGLLRGHALLIGLIAHQLETGRLPRVPEPLHRVLEHHGAVDAHTHAVLTAHPRRGTEAHSRHLLGGIRGQHRLNVIILHLEDETKFLTEEGSEWILGERTAGVP